MALVYLNGDFIAPAEAKVSILDRGFLFGDSVYELIPIFSKKAFGLEAHLTRLQQSCDALQIHMAFSTTHWKSIAEQLVAGNEPEAKAHKLYIQITRGIVPSLKDRKLQASSALTPTIVAQCCAYEPPTIEKLQQGTTAITHSDIRRSDCHIKSNALIANVLMQQTIDKHQVDDVILIKDGYAQEGNTNNLFLVKNQQLITPATNNHILNGITRQSIIDLAKAHGIPCLEIPVPADQLKAADEIWLSSSTREIVPVVTLNGQTTGFEPKGSLWLKMIAWYQAMTRGMDVIS